MDSKHLDRPSGVRPDRRPARYLGTDPTNSNAPLLRTTRTQSLRQWLRWQLAPFPGAPLTPLSRLLALLILLSVAIGIIATEPVVHARWGEELLLAETLLGVVFLLELMLRVWSAGCDPQYRGFSGLWRYLRRPLVLVDILVVLTLLAPVLAGEFVVLRLLRLLRLIALARFGRYSTALRTLLRALARRRYELSLSVVLASLILLVAATGMYLLEAAHQPEAFGSIPRALWWSVATLTTVGYGDVYPVTALGRLFAGITAIAGIGLIALPAGILASAFSEMSSTRD